MSGRLSPFVGGVFGAREADSEVVAVPAEAAQGAPVIELPTASGQSAQVGHVFVAVQHLRRDLTVLRSGGALTFKEPPEIQFKGTASRTVRRR